MKFYCGLKNTVLGFTVVLNVNYRNSLYLAVSYECDFGGVLELYLFEKHHVISH